MDAQNSREYGCQKHLHGNRYPACKQPYSNSASDRAPVEVPDHWLGKSLSYPTAQGIRIVVFTTNPVIQLASECRRICQVPFKSVTAHGYYSAEESRKPQQINVVTLYLLNYSSRNDK